MRQRGESGRRMRYDFAYAVETFVQTILNDYAKLSGRVDRRDFWHFASIVAAIFMLVLALSLVSRQLSVIGLVGCIGFIIPSCAIAVRRLHDAGASGWLLLVPGLNIILLAFRGRVGPNRFGPDPLGARLDAFA